MTDDALEYLEKLEMKLKGLNRTFTTEILIDEDKIAEAVARKMKTQMTGRTTEGFGGF